MSSAALDHVLHFGHIIGYFGKVLGWNPAVLVEERFRLWNTAKTEESRLALEQAVTSLLANPLWSSMLFRITAEGNRPGFVLALLNLDVFQMVHRSQGESYAERGYAVFKRRGDTWITLMAPKRIPDVSEYQQPTGSSS